MLSREESIKIATDAAIEWYENEDIDLDFVEASQENDENWVITFQFELFGRKFTSEWRVWEYQGKPGFEIIGG